MLTEMQLSLRSACTRGLRRQSGQALVQMALIMTTLFGMIGAGIDWGNAIIEDARLQHASDAAALAGVRALVGNQSAGTTAAETAATNYLTMHGYTHGANTRVNINFSSSMGTSFMDTITVVVDHTKPTMFWKMMGIETTSSRGRSVARPGAALVDVMLSLDLTGSMESSGTNDLAQLRQAVVDFINQLDPNPDNPYGPKLGISRFAGKYCSWNRNGDGDSKVDLWSPGGEFVTPCYDDKTVLTNLTFDKAKLLKIANNSGTGTCPAGVSPFGCPLDVVQKYPVQTNGTPTTPTNWHCNNSNCGSLPANTGTKLPNGISVANNASYHAWATANGGRNGAGTDPYARKVLVMMTDGVNEVISNDPQGESASTWNADVVTYANALKPGPDGIAGNSDDVEVYVVGFFCTPYSTSTSGTPERWCKSKMADTAQPHPCPAAVWPTASASSTDTMLKNVSSSSAGSCDRYYPLKKSESLPQLFQKIAGAIARGKLGE